jgi:hypothetical protein
MLVPWRYSRLLRAAKWRRRCGRTRLGHLLLLAYACARAHVPAGRRTDLLRRADQGARAATRDHEGVDQGGHPLQPRQHLRVQCKVRANSGSSLWVPCPWRPHPKIPIRASSVPKRVPHWFLLWKHADGAEAGILRAIVSRSLTLCGRCIATAVPRADSCRCHRCHPTHTCCPEFLYALLRVDKRNSHGGRSLSHTIARAPHCARAQSRFHFLHRPRHAQLVRCVLVGVVGAALPSRAHVLLFAASGASRPARLCACCVCGRSPHVWGLGSPHGDGSLLMRVCCALAPGTSRTLPSKRRSEAPSAALVVCVRACASLLVAALCVSTCSPPLPSPSVCLGGCTPM